MIRKGAILSNVLLALILTCAVNINAQVIDGSFSPSAGLMPGSPEAATLIKFVDVPVSPYTGTPDVTIPITSIKEHKLQLQVSLSYHAGGHRVDEIANWVGMGWKLNAGGMITRKVRGLPDDAKIGLGFLKFRDQHDYDETIDWLQAQDEVKFQSLASGCWDAEPDEFYFEMNGLSGKFVFDWENNLPRISSLDDVKIIDFVQDSHGTITSWKMAGPDGVIYTFSALEKTRVHTDFSFFSPCNSGNHTYVSTWHLTSVQDPNRPQHKIQLTYEHYQIQRGWTHFETRAYANYPTPENCSGSYSGISKYDLSNVFIDGKRLSAITTSSGRFRIDFIAETPRTDFDTATHFYRLDQIVLKGQQGDVLSKHILDYFYQGRLMLDSIQTIGEENQSLPPYSFEYYSNHLPDITSKSVDHWGFYNGASNQTLLPEYIHHLWNGTIVYYPGADREPKLEYARAAVLKKITYPTGGSIELDYELNAYSFVGAQSVESQNQYVIEPDSTALTVTGNLDNTEWVIAEHSFTIESVESSVLVSAFPKGATWATFGGMAVLPQIKLLREDGSVVAAWQLGVGDPTEEPPYHQTLPVKYLSLTPGNYKIWGKARKYWNAIGTDYIQLYLTWNKTSASAPLIRKFAGGVRAKEISSFNSDGQATGLRRYEYEMEDDSGYASGVIYAEPVYVYDGVTLNSYGQECSYVQLVGAGRVSLGSTNGSHIGYRRVTEYHGAEGENGRIVYEYTSPFEYTDGLNLVKPFKSPTSNSFKTGLLRHQYVYDAQGQPVKEIHNQYEFVQQNIQSLKVSLGRIAPPAYTGNLFQDMFLGSAYATYPFYDKFAFSYAPYRIGLARIKTASQTLDGVNSTTVYEYDELDRHNRPTAVSVTNSDGKVHRTENDYAFESSADCLADKNMVSLPTETRVFVADQLTGGSRVDYGNDGYGGCAPLNFYQILVDGSDLLRGRILSYHANGYPALTRKTGFPEEAFTWEDGLLIQWQYGATGGETPARIKYYDYHPNSRLVTRFTDIDGQQIEYGYDGFQRLAEVSTRDGNITTTYDYEYGQPNRITTTTTYGDAPTRIQSQSFDGLGRPLVTTENDRLKKKITSDSLGRMEKETYLPGNFVNYVYDDSPLVRVMEKIFPDGSSLLYDYHSEDQYYLQTVTDENDHPTTTVTDILGRVVEVRNALDGVTRNEYDLRGNLVKVIPPMGDSWQYIFEYSYDNRNRVIAKRIPGADWQTFSYHDQTDRMLGVTDGEGHELTYEYDVFGRNTVTRLNGQEIFSSHYDAGPPINIGKVVATEAKILGVNDSITTDYQYDAYGRPSLVTASNHLGGQDIVTTEYNHADWVLNIARQHTSDFDSIDITKTNSYDDYGRVTAIHFFVNGIGGLISERSYNERDQLTRNVLGGGLQKLDYRYNQRGWLTRINQPLGPFDAIQAEAEPLPLTESAEGGSGSGISFRSSTTRTPGSSSKMVMPQAFSTDDLFYLQLSYGWGNSVLNAAPQFNGNVSAITWQVAGRDRQAYGFSYDPLNRMTGAEYGQINSSGVYDVNHAYSVFDVSYDPNGNITGIMRNGRYAAGQGHQHGLIDQLTYTYKGNQLKTVDDTAPAASRLHGFRPGKPGIYNYDKNGNLTHDPHKKLDIAYNHLNLPKEIIGADTLIRFTYDAVGTKLKKAVKGQYTRDYVSGIEYRDGLMEAIYHDEGRVVLSDQGDGMVFQYTIRDHLGNIRLVFADLNDDGNISIDDPDTKYDESEILQQHHYYPFGMAMEGDWTDAAAAPENNYRYNGKELNMDSGLNWYDYGARWYDPALCRWLSPDPLASKFPAWSPYTYAFDNPVKYIDPDGRSPIDGGILTYIISLVNAENYTEVTQITVTSTSASNYDIDGEFTGSTTTETVTTVTNTIDIYGEVTDRGDVVTTTTVTRTDASGQEVSSESTTSSVSQSDTTLDLGRFSETTDQMAGYAAAHQSHFVSDYLGSGKKALNWAFTAGQVPLPAIFRGMTGRLIAAVGLPKSLSQLEKTVSGAALDPANGIISSIQVQDAAGRLVYDSVARKEAAAQRRQDAIESAPPGIKQYASGVQWVIDKINSIFW